MFRFDNARFVSEYEAAFGKLSEQAKEGLDFLLSQVQQDAANWRSIPQIAYGLATCRWETGRTFQPVYERGSREYFNKYEPSTQIGKDLGNTQPGDGFLYRGRGYVQITGRANYARASRELSVDLVAQPDRALEPPIAYQIGARGMSEGWFTGVRLSRYLPENGQPDYFNARRMINRLDRAEEIAESATKIEQALRQAQIATEGPEATAATGT